MATRAPGDQESIDGDKGAEWSRGHYVARGALIARERKVNRRAHNNLPGGR